MYFCLSLVKVFMRKTIFLIRPVKILVKQSGNYRLKQKLLKPVFMYYILKFTGYLLIYNKHDLYYILKYSHSKSKKIETFLYYFLFITNETKIKGFEIFFSALHLCLKN